LVRRDRQNLLLHFADERDLILVARRELGANAVPTDWTVSSATR
jgi:hypothetical protein